MQRAARLSLLVLQADLAARRAAGSLRLAKPVAELDPSVQA